MSAYISTSGDRATQGHVGHASPTASDFQFYRISVAAPDLIRVSIFGFWPPNVAKDFVREIAQAVTMLSGEPQSHLILCDVTNSALQSQAVCSEFTKLLSESDTAARAVAFVTQNPVSRMQARRLIAGQKNAALFDCEDVAHDWLAQVSIAHV